jgi:tRNA-specific 2-thiouridylase
MSGGVDSSVAAHILKEQGCRVFGIYMKTWDELEEGESHCTREEDRIFAQRACDHLSIPLVEVDLVAQYWQSVFEPYLDKFKLGVTPNPDLYCNRFIKFGVLMDHAQKLGADALATGHFARLRQRHSPCAGDDDTAVELLRGIDPWKDQTYFLSRVTQSQLKSALFPVGNLTKEDVRALARSIGLPNAGRKSTSGICFIGKRNFTNFLQQYMDPTPGEFVSVDGERMGRHQGLELYTRGQRSRIETGGRGAFYVVGKDVESKTVFVAEDRSHSSQFSKGAFVKDLHWIAGDPPQTYQASGTLSCLFKARYLEEDSKCTLLGEGGERTFTDKPTKFYGEDKSDKESTETAGNLYVKFQSPHPAITPEQALVFYDGEVCLGSALIHRPGLTLFEEEGHRKPAGVC